MRTLKRKSSIVIAALVAILLGVATRALWDATAAAGPATVDFHQTR